MPSTEALDGSGPNRVLLASELRRLRKQAGVSGRLLAKRTGISQSKVSRIEGGAITPTMPEVTAWADAVGTTAATKDHLSALTEAAFAEVYSWRRLRADRPHLQQEISQREAAASRIRTFQPSIVPGLLQTVDYAASIFAMSPLPYRQDDLSAAVSGRMRRQAALQQGSGRFEFLVTESALRWRPGSARVLVSQLERIAALSVVESIVIGVIPHSTDAITAIPHGFVIYDDAIDDQSYVTIETIHANVEVVDPPDVALYQTQWTLLSRMAVFGQAARDAIATLAVQLRGEAP